MRDTIDFQLILIDTDTSLRMKTVVVSAVNLVEGGPLTVLRDCLSTAVEQLPAEWQIVALVHSEDLVDHPRVRTIVIPDAKRSWWRRLRWEWIGFSRIARQLRPDLWLSLHDITSRVSARRSAVYCHNASPFYRVSFREALQDPKFLAFNLLYASLYRILIHRNRWVIVQQEWLRNEFQRRMGPLPIVVARPTLPSIVTHNAIPLPASPRVFLYPALPRTFKNLETVCEAARILISRGVNDFEVRLTTDGRDNGYARWLYRRYSKIAPVRFIGRQSRTQMYNQYREAHAVVFASRLETWGLPISEAKTHQLPLLVADLPYAHETVGKYGPVSFFPAGSPQSLADLMSAFINGTWVPSGSEHPDPFQPFAPDWGSLWRILISDL